MEVTIGKKGKGLSWWGHSERQGAAGWELRAPAPVLLACVVGLGGRGRLHTQSLSSPPSLWESQVTFSAPCPHVPSPTAVLIPTPSLALLLLPGWGPSWDSDTEAELVFSVHLATSGLFVWCFLVVPQSLAPAPVPCAQHLPTADRERGWPEHHTWLCTSTPGLSSEAVSGLEKEFTVAHS